MTTWDCTTKQQSISCGTKTGNAASPCLSSAEPMNCRKLIVLLRISAFSVPDTACAYSSDEYPEDCREDSYTDDLYCENWDWCTANWKRGCRQCRSTSSTKKPKIAPHKTARASVQRKQVRTKEKVQQNVEARKENNERRLQERHLQRFGYEIYHRRTDYVGKRPNKMTAPHSYVPHKGRSRTTEDHPATLLYELKKDDICDDFSRLLADLQHRDLTPEDYELLLRLDEKVAPKTISQSALSSFDSLTLQSASTLVGELCSICMEVYCESQRVKTLPCQHTFHCDCIDTWLSSASLNCPLDGMAVQP